MQLSTNAPHLTLIDAVLTELEVDRTFVGARAAMMRDIWQQSSPFGIGKCMPKKLKVDISEIADAMEASFDGELHYFLDSEMGKVILIQDEVLSAVESNDEERINGFPDWEKEVVTEAKRISEDKKNGRFVAIPALESWESFKHMEYFVETVEDDDLHEKLMIALDGKGAFGRFKRVLELHPPQRERWFKFKEDRMAEEVKRFLISEDIEAIEASK